MNRKAQVFKTMMWITRAIFLAIVVLSIVLMVRSKVVNNVDIFDVESNNAMASILYSPNAFTYYDVDLERYYPGIIDQTKFTSDRAGQILHEAIDYGPENKQLAAKFVLNHFEKDKQPSGKEVWIESEIGTLMINPAWYDRWDVLADSGVKGPGGARKIERKFYVHTIDEYGDIYPALLKISIIIPNS